MLKRIAVLAALGTVALAFSTPASAQERTVKITGFGAKSGVVRVFGSDIGSVAGGDFFWPHP